MTYISQKSMLHRILRKKQYNPAILLDIDGVISPMGAVDGLKRRSRQVAYSNFAVTDEVASFFAELSHDGVDIIWASTWEDECVVLGDELGIRNSGYIAFGGMHRGNNWFKENAAKKFITDNKHRKIAWLDDETPDHLISWAKSSHSDIFAEQVEPMKGVNSDLMTRLEDFLKR